MDIRTRFAPSPTGFLHIGAARTALFNFLFAKNRKGAFILRIEDTDIQRSDPKFEKDILENLTRLGIKWDEGPYRQSERISVYEKYLEKLLGAGRAFWCPHTEEELEKERNEQLQNKMSPRHVCEFRDKNLNEGEILRFKNDEKNSIEFSDLIRGEISFKADLLGDFSLAKNMKTPLYNFAVVVDDYDMKISHVIRGEDHISNTPKQILIQKSLGFFEPWYAHIPLILGKDRSKLSKRHGAVSVSEYLEDGYLEEALINFMAFLGWHPAPPPAAGGESACGSCPAANQCPDVSDLKGERELFSLGELIGIFSLERVQKSPAVFNVEKLNWLNKEYIKNIPASSILKRIIKYIPKNWKEKIEKDSLFAEKIIELEKPRITKLSEFKEKVGYFFEKPHYEKELLKWKPDQDFQEIEVHLDKFKNIIQNISPKNFDQKNLVETIMPYAEEKGRGKVLWPFRVLLTGLKASPGPFEIAEILGKKEVIERLKEASKIIKG